MGKYSSVHQVEAVVKGGFPVIVKGTVCFPDRSVGLDYYWVDDAELLTLRGKPCKFMEKKLTKSEWELLEEKLIDDYCSGRDSDD